MKGNIFLNQTKIGVSSHKFLWRLNVNETSKDYLKFNLIVVILVQYFPSAEWFLYRPVVNLLTPPCVWMIYYNIWN